MHLLTYLLYDYPFVADAMRESLLLASVVATACCRRALGHLFAFDVAKGVADVTDQCYEEGSCRTRSALDTRTAVAVELPVLSSRTRPVTLRVRCHRRGSEAKT